MSDSDGKAALCNAGLNPELPIEKIYPEEVEVRGYQEWLYFKRNGKGILAIKCVFHMGLGEPDAATLAKSNQNKEKLLRFLTP